MTLPSRCLCGRRVRVLWFGPISPSSRPLLLVCGYYPRSRCTFRRSIPDDAIETVNLPDKRRGLVQLLSQILQAA